MATGTQVGSIVLLALCAGCASKTEFPEHPLGARTPLQEASEKTIKIDYAGEPGKGERPRVGLALSGGGTRAGMFAFGVLNGLNDTRVLDHVDVISSVSGGGYAAYWLYARRLEAQQAKTDYRLAFADCRPDWWVKYDADPTNYSLLKQGGKKLLEYGEMVACTEKGDDEGQEWSGPADVYRWQAHISQSPDLFRKRRMVFGGTNGRGPDKEAIPVTAMSLFEMLRFPFVNNGYLGQSYEEGITRTWGLTPLPRTGRASDTVRYANAETDFTGGAYVAPGEHTWQKLRDLGKADSTVPLWIVNTTVLPKQSAPNEKAIFEVTQFSYGSEASGYVAIQEPAAGASGASSSGAVLHPEEIEELPKTVRASAAAADSQGFVTNHWRSADGFTKVLPALRWGVTVEDTNLGNVPVSYRLSDGGGSDNMGLISLVRRGVKDIILVDAESDIEGRFGGLCWDKEILHKAGYELSFPGLEDLPKLCAQHTAKRKKGSAETKRAYNISAWLNPVTKGVIEPLPTKALVNGEKREIPPMNVWLIKLAWNQDLVRKAYNATECETNAHPVSCMLAAYYGHQGSTAMANEVYHSFPQIGTKEAVWNSSTPQFWAWRELGRSAASLFVFDEGVLSLKTTSPKLAGGIQPLLCGTPERQAISCP